MGRVSSPNLDWDLRIPTDVIAVPVRVVTPSRPVNGSPMGRRGVRRHDAPAPQQSVSFTGRWRKPSGTTDSDMTGRVLERLTGPGHGPQFDRPSITSTASCGHVTVDSPSTGGETTWPAGSWSLAVTGTNVTGAPTTKAAAPRRT